MKKQICKSPFFLCFLQFLLIGGCSKNQDKKEPPAYPVAVGKAIVCDVPSYRDYVGHTEAYTTVQLQSQIEGVVTGQYFTEGQSVKSGDLLLTIDVRPYKAALAKAEAVLAQNVATLKFSAETVRRYSKLVQEEFVSQLNYDQYVTDLQADEAIIQQNLADIETAKLNVEYCYLYSPMDAVAGILQVDVGNLVEPGGSTLVTLNQVTPIYAIFSIPEGDLPQIQSLQQKQSLTTLAILNQDYNNPIEGSLSIINNQVQTSTGTVSLKAVFPNENKALWPGEFVDVRVILFNLKNAILVPSQAVQVGQKGHYLYIVKPDQTVDLRWVKIGQKYHENQYIVVESGVNPGETVVLEGQINLYPGAKIAVSKQQEDNVPTPLDTESPS